MFPQELVQLAVDSPAIPSQAQQQLELLEVELELLLLLAVELVPGLASAEKAFAQTNNFLKHIDHRQSSPRCGFRFLGFVQEC